MEVLEFSRWINRLIGSSYNMFPRLHNAWYSINFGLFHLPKWDNAKLLFTLDAQIHHSSYHPFQGHGDTIKYSGFKMCLLYSRVNGAY